jgi:alpha-tubulin suppressor-like RCC1 family protein
MAWGQNFRGQLGDGTFSSSNVPVMVSGLEDVDIVAVAVGWQFSLALSSAGEVWAWGANESGQLGDDTLLDRAEPARVEGLEDIVAIEASSRTALALDATGNLWTWGSGEFGQLGNGSFDEFSAEPLRIGKLATSVVDFDAGLDCFVLALDDGRLLTWGLNNVGTLGDGSYFNRNAPVEVETPFGTGEAPTDFVPCDPDVDPDRCRARR